MKANYLKSRFGSVVITKRIGTTQLGKRKVCMWEYLCDCGKTGQVTHERLSYAKRKGAIQSCGCKNFRGINGNCKGSPKQASYNAWLNKYKQSADDREIEWQLDDKVAIEFFKQDCYYCGVKPKHRYNRYVISGEFKYRRENEWNTQSWITVNGIDRLDNNVGYIIGNVVPCCTVCNRAKLDMPYDEWFEWLNQVVKFRSEPCV